MTKKGKKRWAKIPKIGRRVLADTYIAAASPEKKITLIKIFLKKIASEYSAINYENVEVEFKEKRFRLIYAYKQIDPKMANLIDIMLLFLSGLLVNQNIQVNLDSVVVNIQDSRRKQKAQIEAPMNAIYSFTNGFEPIGFVSAWRIEKHDKNFQVEEALLNFKIEELGKRFEQISEATKRR